MQSHFSQEFYKVPEVEENQEIQVDFPLPSSPDKLREFIASEEGAKFKTGVGKLLHKIAAWAEQQWAGDKSKAELLAHIEHFKNRFDYSGTNLEENTKRFKLYVDGMKNLTGILQEISKEKLRFSITTYKRNLYELFESMIKCSDGIHENIYLCLNRITQDPAKKIMSARKELATQFLLDMIRKDEFLKTCPAGNEIHECAWILNQNTEYLGIEPIHDDSATLEHLHQPVIDALGLLNEQQFKPKIKSLMKLEPFCHYILNTFDAEITDLFQQAEKMKADAQNDEIICNFVFQALSNELSIYGSDPGFDLTAVADENEEGVFKLRTIDEVKSYLLISLLQRLINNNYIAKEKEEKSVRFPYVREVIHGKIKDLVTKKDIEINVEILDIIQFYPDEPLQLGYVTDKDQQFRMPLTHYILEYGMPAYEAIKAKLTESQQHELISAVLDSIKAGKNKNILDTLLANPNLIKQFFSDSNDWTDDMAKMAILTTAKQAQAAFGIFLKLTDEDQLRVSKALWGKVFFSDVLEEIKAGNNELLDQLLEAPNLEKISKMFELIVNLPPSLHDNDTKPEERLATYQLAVLIETLANPGQQTKIIFDKQDQKNVKNIGSLITQSRNTIFHLASRECGDLLIHLKDKYFDEQEKFYFPNKAGITGLELISANADPYSLKKMLPIFAKAAKKEDVNFSSVLINVLTRFDINTRKAFLKSRDDCYFNQALAWMEDVEKFALYLQEIQSFYPKEEFIDMGVDVSRIRLPIFKQLIKTFNISIDALVEVGDLKPNLKYQGKINDPFVFLYIIKSLKPNKLEKFLHSESVSNFLKSKEVAKEFFLEADAALVTAVLRSVGYLPFFMLFSLLNKGELDIILNKLDPKVKAELFNVPYDYSWIAAFPRKPFLLKEYIKHNPPTKNALLKKYQGYTALHFLVKANHPDCFSVLERLCRHEVAGIFSQDKPTINKIVTNIDLFDKFAQHLCKRDSRDVEALINLPVGNVKVIDYLFNLDSYALIGLLEKLIQQDYDVPHYDLPIQILRQQVGNASVIDKILENEDTVSFFVEMICRIPSLEIYRVGDPLRNFLSYPFSNADNDYLFARLLYSKKINPQLLKKFIDHTKAFHYCRVPSPEGSKQLLDVIWNRDNPELFESMVLNNNSYYNLSGAYWDAKPELRNVLNQKLVAISENSQDNTMRAKALITLAQISNSFDRFNWLTKATVYSMDDKLYIPAMRHYDNLCEVFSAMHYLTAEDKDKFNTALLILNYHTENKFHLSSYDPNNVSLINKIIDFSAHLTASQHLFFVNILFKLSSIDPIEEVMRIHAELAEEKAVIQQDENTAIKARHLRSCVGSHHGNLELAKQQLNDIKETILRTDWHLYKGNEKYQINGKRVPTHVFKQWQYIEKAEKGSVSVLFALREIKKSAVAAAQELKFFRSKATQGFYEGIALLPGLGVTLH